MQSTHEYTRVHEQLQYGSSVCPCCLTFEFVAFVPVGDVGEPTCPYVGMLLRRLFGQEPFLPLFVRDAGQHHVKHMEIAFPGHLVRHSGLFQNVTRDGPAQHGPPVVAATGEDFGERHGETSKERTEREPRENQERHREAPREPREPREHQRR